jgi:NTP pyrophosphatase (non-canonical NTP hydrolase)
MEKFSNDLTDVQLERLAILSEELGEAQQIIGKVIRHGYESGDPTKPYTSNRLLLEKELGHVFMALAMLTESNDLSYQEVVRHQNEKRGSIKRWLHHQPDSRTAGSSKGERKEREI